MFPSLRVYLLTRRLGVPVVDVMHERYELLRELECITEAVARAGGRSPSGA